MLIHVVLFWVTRCRIVVLLMGSYQYIVLTLGHWSSSDIAYCAQYISILFPYNGDQENFLYFMLSNLSQWALTPLLTFVIIVCIYINKKYHKKPQHETTFCLYLTVKPLTVCNHGQLKF